jgi:hypothetical protein
MPTPETVENPRYVNAEGTMIDCDVKWSHLPVVWPFTASPDDPAEHGRALYAALVAGEHGEIAPYAP